MLIVPIGHPVALAGSQGPWSPRVAMMDDGISMAADMGKHGKVESPGGIAPTCLPVTSMLLCRIGWGGRGVARLVQACLALLACRVIGTFPAGVVYCHLTCQHVRANNTLPIFYTHRPLSIINRQHLLCQQFRGTEGQSIRLHIKTEHVCERINHLCLRNLTSRLLLVRRSQCCPVSSSDCT